MAGGWVPQEPPVSKHLHRYVPEHSGNAYTWDAMTWHSLPLSTPPPDEPIQSFNALPGQMHYVWLAGGWYMCTWQNRLGYIIHAAACTYVCMGIGWRYMYTLLLHMHRTAQAYASAPISTSLIAAVCKHNYKHTIVWETGESHTHLSKANCLPTGLILSVGLWLDLC